MYLYPYFIYIYMYICIPTFRSLVSSGCNGPGEVKPQPTRRAQVHLSWTSGQGGRGHCSLKGGYNKKEGCRSVGMQRMRGV